MATRLRRTLAVPVVAAAVLLGTAVPAVANFSVTRTLQAIQIVTATLQPPTGIQALLGSCSNGRWMNVTVSWTASPSPGVTGYTVTAHRNDGSVIVVAQTPASATSVSTTVDRLSSGSTTVTFVVTAQLQGWTADSVASGSLTC